MKRVAAYTALALLASAGAAYAAAPELVTGLAESCCAMLKCCCD